jgi:NDP-sugar pyrophosphorylase family protein
MSGSRTRRLKNPDPRTKLLRRKQVGGTKTVILAGGKGARLKPYTSILPKPLLPLGDRSILELLMAQLARQGFVDITLSVGHLGHLIEAVLGNGASRSVDITYVREEVPLGTAGSLRLVSGLTDTFLMLNGDLVTTLDFQELVSMHRESGNMLTIATSARQVRTEYGVLSVEDDTVLQRVVRYDEKPVFDCLVSMGIYVVEPQALGFIPDGRYFDFPDLVHGLLRAGARVGAFVYDGLWLDIGRREDYEQANALWEEGTLAPLYEGVASPQQSPAMRVVAST